MKKRDAQCSTSVFKSEQGPGEIFFAIFFRMSSLQRACGRKSMTFGDIFFRIETHQYICGEKTPPGQMVLADNPWNPWNNP